MRTWEHLDLATGEANKTADALLLLQARRKSSRESKGWNTGENKK